MTASTPRHVFHESFREPGAAERYAPGGLADRDEYQVRFMPDEATREFARRMHYAAYRSATARSSRDADRWRQAYYRLRDAIVLGNRKLVYKAVRRRMAVSNRSDDLIGDCYLVLIQAVAAYNPWLGIRFSTYAFTCLLRALSRLSQRIAADWLGRSLPLEALRDGAADGPDEPSEAGSTPLDDFLRADHPLLTPREKAILTLRFSLADRPQARTLQQVGRELGLSKERVRQVQATALDKLRQALAGPAKT